ncbi:hypothetical protein ACH0B5_03525 [Ureibacillus sp. 179-F W5.1 NHS]|uniref:Uncharacterized protein n=1 Tax=Lysinibacillus halotolerans TaxID=1368476 RepID=A0A3M8H8C7_9BACI|nr:hypothetical protein [Lysinibacillus halotolerans]RNC98474.1 hypothetical protein EC501_10895 [Lysinibacillus halotolerans]
MSFVKNLENVLLLAKEEQTRAILEKLKEANVDPLVIQKCEAAVERIDIEEYFQRFCKEALIDVENAEGVEFLKDMTDRLQQYERNIKDDILLEISEVLMLPHNNRNYIDFL